MPKSRPDEMENPSIKEVTRDYIMYPKKSGYQSLHVYAIPDYVTNIKPPSLPKGIIPPKNSLCAMEYHFYTRELFNYQAYGLASHKKSYKPHESTYHRLAVPQFITLNNLDEDLPSNNIEIPNSKINVNNFAQCFKKFYGISFKDLFGISFTDFRDRLKQDDRDDVLALDTSVSVDSNNNIIRNHHYGSPVVATIEELKDSKEFLDTYIFRNQPGVIKRKAVYGKSPEKASIYAVVKKADVPRKDLSPEANSKLKKLTEYVENAVNYVLSSAKRIFSHHDSPER